MSNRLVSGGEGDPLYRYLREELAQAANADIAVGFVMPSGLQRLEPHLRDFLARNGRLRLLDLEGDRQIRVFEAAHPSGPEPPGPPASLCFHPKAYVFERRDGTGIAFVGSSNLSESALLTGIEWNRLRLQPHRAPPRPLRCAPRGDPAAVLGHLPADPARRPTGLLHGPAAGSRRRRPLRVDPDLGRVAHLERFPRDGFDTIAESVRPRQDGAGPPSVSQGRRSSR